MNENWGMPSGVFAGIGGRLSNAGWSGASSAVGAMRDMGGGSRMGGILNSLPGMMSSRRGMGMGGAALLFGGAIGYAHHRGRSSGSRGLQGRSSGGMM